jgi:hypothetical protein
MVLHQGMANSPTMCQDSPLQVPPSPNSTTLVLIHGPLGTPKTQTIAPVFTDSGRT